MGTSRTYESETGTVDNPASKTVERDEEDLGAKLLELQERSDHPDFEHVGYIKWVHDNVEEEGKVSIEVTYPDGSTEFQNTFKWPEDWNVDSRLKRLVEHEDLPFSTGTFTNEALQDEPVPIDPEAEQIYVPKTAREKVSETVGSKLMAIPFVAALHDYAKKNGLLDTLMVLGVKAVYLVTLITIIVALIMLVIL